jgi:hypothetical protein
MASWWNEVMLFRKFNYETETKLDSEERITLYYTCHALYSV